MAEYEDFERDFISRTLLILDQYDRQAIPEKERFEVTLLINCLLGLLVLPKEFWFDKVPRLDLSTLAGWSFEPRYVIEWGDRPKTLAKEDHGTLREIVYRMRNGVAHLQIKATGDGHDITAIEFADWNGFRATLPVTSLALFVRKLATEMLKAVGTR